MKWYYWIPLIGALTLPEDELSVSDNLLPWMIYHGIWGSIIFFKLDHYFHILNY